ncbi:MAG: c-type cytochrome [Opitutaceae bacterium]|nr:c-type cytochrome [Verrucomicrobiales bacterium]
MTSFQRLLQIPILIGLSASSALAQNGDKAGEVQAPLVADHLIPPAPVLSPADAQKAFRIQPGFRIELVASEPLVKQPVAIQFDGDGRLWVLEMQGYMPNPDGIGENRPVGTVSYLEDMDGDGRMDKRTEFADKLVMPRAMLVMHDGVLIAEPPRLWFYPMKNGKAGNRVEIAGDYAKEADTSLGTRANPEHSANSLLWAMDNWIYSAKFTFRFRRLNGEWKREPTVLRGQWGLSQDDFGRLVYNSNSDQFRMDLVPSAYLSRNPNHRTTAGLNFDPIKNQAVWPIRVTPGINRGYQQGMLRDGKLVKFTAACSPLIYRGNTFPSEYYGNAFVCEPSANLIKRNILIEKNGEITGRHASENDEFLASMDERFRPVNLNIGPDGNLYIVDLYHGIIQHRVFLTSYLRKQSESRGLDQPNGLGRIWRVVPDGYTPAGKKPQMSKASAVELVEGLSHPNGWWRDTAQQLLVQRAEAASVPLLEKLVVSGAKPLGRLHALWTLDGMGRLEAGVDFKAIQDADPKVQMAAIRLSEPFLKDFETKDDAFAALAKQLASSSADVQLQLALTLGQVPDATAEQGMLKLAREASGSALVREALVTGLVRRELEFAEKILQDKAAVGTKPGQNSLLSLLAKAVLTEGRPVRVNRLFELTASASGGSRLSLLDGLITGVAAPNRGKAAPSQIKPVVFAQEPAGFIALKKSGDPEVEKRLDRLSEVITWPGQPGYVAPPAVVPLTAGEKKLFDIGKELYSATCTPCHQPHGLGMEGLAPPLAGSEWVTGSDQRLARIILHGVRGPIMVKGQMFELEMPGLAILEDEQIAALLTYIRREWDNTANPVTVEAIKAIRAATATREEAWTAAELQALK